MIRVILQDRTHIDFKMKTPEIERNFRNTFYTLQEEHVVDLKKHGKYKKKDIFLVLRGNNKDHVDELFKGTVSYIQNLLINLSKSYV